MDKKELRSSIFRHLDGIVTAPVVSSLQKKEIINLIFNSKKILLNEISEKTQSNEGYLNVALRLLSSQGFINYHLDNKNDLSETAATAYDATHGFSDQYIVEVDVFHKICNEVGLSVDKDFFKKYPNSDLATVSINLLKS